jgi:hypothetical protein
LIEDLVKPYFIFRLLNLVLCLLLVGCTQPSKPSIATESVVPTNKATPLIIDNNQNNPSFTETPEVNSIDGNVPQQVVNISDLWVDAANGNDVNDGLTPTTAFRSIQKAAEIAAPGITVHILPGIYRENVKPTMSGSPSSPIIYRAENGPGTVIIRGSEPSASLVWTQLMTDNIGLPSEVDPSNIYFTDLSAWNLDSQPLFIVALDDNGQVTSRLPLAREPDWQVNIEWKYQEFWWAADGGFAVAGCDPSTNQDRDCDTPWRSTTQLTDRTDDQDPIGIEPGNLTTLGDLTGATLVALDTDEGHYTYHRKIIAHDVANGTITVDQPCEFDSGSGNPGLGWGSKYYIENHPSLLDNPGEWWYDINNARLYLWPLIPEDPGMQNIEISRQPFGFQLSNLSYITLEDLTLEFFNEDAVIQDQSCDGCSSHYNTVRNSILRYANVGIVLEQSVDYPSNITDGFTVEDTEIGYMDSRAIYLNYWWQGDSADTFTHAGIVNTVIRNNELHHLGFRSYSDNSMGVLFNYADHLLFEGNYVHHIAQNGVAFSKSVIQSDKEFGFSPDEIKTGDILIKDNIFEKACLLNADCAEVKIQGRVPDNHVFRNVLITGNVFKNTFGWTYVSEKRGRWTGGTNSVVKGMGGFGLYLDFASGVYAYRNIAYNNASSGFHLYSNWWDGDIVIYNNIAANSLNGIRLDGWASRGNVNTQIMNNVLINNEGYGFLIYYSSGDHGNFSIDHNLYYGNGWRDSDQGGLRQAGDMALYGPNKYYQTLADIQSHTPWEDNGIEGNPSFSQYDMGDHDLFDGSWPDFYITEHSTNLIDRGTTSLPETLVTLLSTFDVVDFSTGSTYDIGRYEADLTNIALPLLH